MKTYNEYDLIPCTAIAIADSENESNRQDAILVRKTAESGELFEHLVFGWDMPQAVEDFNEMCEDAGAWESVSDEHHVVWDSEM